MSNSLQPSGGLGAPLLWDFPGKNTGVGCHSFPSPGDLPDLGIEPVPPAWRGDSLLIQPRKPRAEYLIIVSAFSGGGI